MNKIFLHQLPDVAQLFQNVMRERLLLGENLDEGLVEKDYWIMHSIWGIQQQGYRFELKGGTSLSKAFGIIDRFSEDIDIQIHPSDENVKTGKNHDKPSHVNGRKNFFDKIAMDLNIPDLIFRVIRLLIMLT